ncbi:Crp/Fnr family transcriptional regulator [Microvirga sp. CF3016]|uniref:Crp/Fnr family transcriptional regulator n=1 Tax=Microvirga sp. CF3016 TaxID=3110181 RepID=UPI002E766666|nr:Crp/Fnr family transcriptional regulator [Microvirga sp. CF3016]MEE1610359.1 Crp/Fnr family transcriptional regulator [Microvirga sp. CF3016]
MRASSPHEYSPLISKLESIFTLTEEEREALLSLPMQVAALKEDQDIVREGDRPSRCCLILSGLACAYKVTGDGRRQIVSFTVPGDIPDLQSLHLKVLDTSISTLTPCRVGFIQHEILHDLCRRHYRFAAAFWRETLVDAAIFREWTVNVGRREAYHRMAHVLCEMLMRLRAVGLAEDHACELPITQAEFGDALGVSTVHINRVLQALRSEGLIELKDEQLNILDWERLREVGDFDPTYLHLQREAPR